MIGIGGLVVVGLMTSDAGIRRGICIIPVMALVAVCNAGMCASQCIIIIMGRECGRLPARVCCVAGCTGVWNAC